MKFLKNTISKNWIFNAYSLLEILISISISSILITAAVAGTFFVYSGLIRAQTNSVIILNKSKFFRIVTYDILNPDIYPHHPEIDYKLNNNSIGFFANGGPVTYNFNGSSFIITRENPKHEYLKKISLDNTKPGVFKLEINEKEYKVNFISDFKVIYYDYESNEVIPEEEFPDYCELIFIMKDKEEIIMKMRL